MKVNTSNCTIEIIPANEAGLGFYLAHCKPFRLLSLQCDPSAFGSTLAREEAFEDEEWLARLFRPTVTTFIARDRDQGLRVLSSITLIGPRPVSDHSRSQLGLTGPVACWDLNGVFTLPAARRRGIAAAVIDAAKHYALKEAASRESGCLLTIIVYTDNGTAKSWYERMGFKVYQDGEDQGRSTSELSLLL